MSAQVVRGVASDAAPTWAEPIADEMQMVEALLLSTVTSSVPAAYDIAAHLVRAGGKRVRPALVTLSYLASGETMGVELAVRLGAAVELVHMASLVHDDVIDQTSQRRGADTANSRWGNKLSVLGGDFLIGKGFGLLSTSDYTEVSRILSVTAVEMTESEILQAACEGDIAAWKTNYWRIISGKTSEFLRACCDCGAALAGADREARKALAEFGSRFGALFQITDDLLDITGDPRETGKDLGSDLTHGKFTLPVLMASDRLTGSELARFEELTGAGMLSAEAAGEVAEMVVGCGAADAAREIADENARAAIASLDSLPSSRYTKAMISLARNTIIRQS